MHQATGRGNSLNGDRFFTAQVLWDETMAEGIVNFHTKKPDYQVVVLAGQGHIAYGYGIPSRVERRIKDKKFTHTSVLLSEPEEVPAGKDKPIADFIWEGE